ncbi:MAG: methyl-accepting chemotaxis protein [Actinomycetota bacterium]
MRFRLIGAFAVVLTLLVVSLGVAAVRVDSMRSALVEINDVNSVKQRQAINFRGSVHDRSILVRDLALFESPADIERTIAEIRDLEAAYDEARVELNTLQADFPDAEDQAAYDRINEVEAATNPLVQTIVNRAASGQQDAELFAALDASRSLFVDWLASINVYIDRQEAKNQDLGADVSAIADGFTILVVIMALLVIAGGAAAAVLLLRSIMRRIESIGTSMESITADDGTTDLTVRVDDQVGDEFDRIGDACNRVMVKLSSTIRSVSEASNAVNDSASEVAARADSITTGIQRQVDQTARVSSAVEQLSSSIGLIVDCSSTAADASQRSEASARQGGEVVRRVIDQMESIAAQVKSSGDDVEDLGAKGESVEGVIAVINEIAEQTNLLALNAAIEAARAGEHGRGFAVVADEVRMLAERTTGATDEVAQAITEIQEGTKSASQRMTESNDGVAAGVDLVSTAGSTLDDVVTESASVLTMAQEMVQMTDQQVTASGNVAESVAEIEALCAAAADSADEVTDASRRLADRAGQLEQVVTQFRLEPV